MASTTAATNPAAPPSEEQAAPLRKTTLSNKPYYPWWNPNLPWLDLIICWCVSFFFPANKIASLPPSSKEGREFNDAFRTTFDKRAQYPLKLACKKWSKACGGGGLVQCTWKVPRRAEILHEWGIIDKNDELLKDYMAKAKNEEGDFVTVRVWCPSSLVLKENGNDKKDRTVNDCGCIEVESINLKDIAQDVPVVLWFHGGGLTMGSCDFGFDDKIMPLLEKQQQSTGSESVPPLLLASIDYRLAPDYPLPAASIDSLSVIDYCLKNDDKRKIHVSGESAGGYLSLVSAFAAQKHYPGRVQSALVMIPFLSPAADSMSCYMNGPSSIMVSLSWLRWCWRAALEMDDEDADEEDHDVLAVGSNRTAWNKSKWKQNEQWHKFLEPMKGIPSGLDDKETKYIVAVNKADPLYDDGNALMHKLKEAGADVDYVEAMGSHGIGYLVNRKAMAEMIEKWRAAIFVNDE